MSPSNNSDKAQKTEGAVKVSGPRELGVDVIDSSGKVVDHIAYGTGGATGVMGEPIYKDVDNDSWSIKPTISISLDKKTKSIRVSAPKEIYESEAFQKTFKLDDLKTLSSVYKKDPSSQFELSDGTKIGIEEMVKQVDTEAKSFVDNMVNEIAANKLIKGAVGKEIGDLSSSQLVTSQTSGDLEDEKNSDALISIPKAVSSAFPGVSSLKSFSQDTVRQGDFFENFYNLSVNNADEIVRLRKILDDYFKGGKFDDLDEFAKMYALRDFVYTYEPMGSTIEKRAWQGLATAEGAARATARFTASALSIVQGASDLLVNTLEGGASLFASALGQEYKKKSPDEVKWDVINTGIEALFGTDDLNEVLDSQYEERSEYYHAINRSAATCMALSYLVTNIAENVVAGKALGAIISNLASANAVARGAEAIADATGANRIVFDAAGVQHTVTGWGAVMNSLTGTPNPSLWQTLKVLSSADTSKIFAGARSTMEALSAIPGTVAAAQFTGAIARASRILKNGERIATGVDFLAQVTLDTTLSSPTAMRHLISGDATSEDKQAYVRELAWNAGGYGIGIFLAKATNSFSKSKAGDAANAWAAQKMASAKTTFHDMSDSVKSKVWGDDWINNIKNTGKKQVARYNEIIAEANRKIANAGSDLSKGAKTEAIKEAVRKAVAVQNAVDTQESGIRYYMNLYNGGNIKDGAKTYYPALSNALRSESDVFDKMSKLMNSLNISSPIRPTALVNGVSSNLDMPQDVVNYINDVWSVKYLSGKKSKVGLDVAEGKGLEIALERIKGFETQRPKQLSDFIKDRYLPSLEEAYHAINTHRIEAHIESSANRAGIIESGLFGKKGESWIHMQAVSEFQKQAVDNSNRLSSQLSGFAEVEDIPEMFHYSWGSVKDYVHPQLALQNYLWQTAVAENARNSWQDFSPIYKEKTELLVSGERGEAAQVYQNLKKGLDRVSKERLNGIIEDLDVSDALSDVVQDISDEKAFERATKRVEKLQEAASKLKETPLKTTNADKLSAIYSMSDDAVAMALGESSISNIGLSKEGWNSFVESANRKTRNGIIGLFKEHRKLTGYTGDISKLGKINDLGDFLRKTGRRMNPEDYAIEKLDVGRIDKLNALTNPDTFWNDYKSMTKNVRGEHALSRWKDLADARYAQLREGERVMKGEQAVARLKALSWKDYRATLRFHPEINMEIDRVRLQNNKEFLENDVVAKIAEEQKRARLVFEVDTTLKESLSQLNLPTTNSRFEAVTAAKNAVNGFIEGTLKDNVAGQVVDSIAVEIAPENLDVARRYIALKMLEKNKKGLEIKLIKQFTKAKFSAPFRHMDVLNAEAHKKASVKLVMDAMQDELNDARNLLKAAGETIIDEDDVMSDIKKLVKEIDELSDDEAVVSVYNDAGKLELYRTDPVLADLYNYRPIIQPTKAEMALNNPVTRSLNRVSRFFQTTANPKSFRNQFFRDFGNSYFGVGAYKAMGMISSDLQTSYGGALAEKLIEDLKVTSPSSYEFLTKQAAQTGTDIKKLVVDRYMSYGRITSPAETPTSFYREGFESSGTFADTLTKTKNKMAKIWDKVMEGLETPNQVREVYLRNATYAKGLHDGLEAGMTVKEAQQMAQFFQRNATTNFGRQLYHFRALQKTVNYFGAGVNGFTSFWRLFSLDPVGVSTRIFSGLVVPTIFATAMTLADEESREKYIHLPEYYKSEQFVFMMNGEFYAIPIPQELESFVAPVRQAVESLYDSNRNAYGELLLSDFLNIAPIDFGAVMMVDRNRLLKDSPSFLDRAGALGLDLVNQTFNTEHKLIFESITGIDAFTGDRIDNSYYMIDDEGNRVLVGGTTSKFALKLAEQTGASPSIISHVVKTLTSQVGEDILDVVYGGDSPATLVEEGTDSLMSFKMADYNLIRAEWNNTVADLWAEKTDTYLPAYVEYSEKINLTKDPAEKERLRVKRQDAIQPFLDKVKTVVGNLKSSYGGSYDRFRLASVVSLLTFDTGTTSGNTNEARLASRDTFNDNRNNAYLWMMANGLNASSDRSILGYITRNEDGENVIKYNTPISILAMRDAIYGAADRDIANIQTLLDDAKIKRNEMKAGYDAAKAKGKSELKQYKADWNAKVVKILAPYIRERGVDAVMNNSATRDMLDNYLYVDNLYQTKQYLKKIFEEE